MNIYLPIAEMSVSLLLIVCIGGAVGFVAGLFGVGGGFLLTPLLIFLGIPPATVVASQSAQIAASSATSVMGALWRKGVDIKLGAFLVVGGAIGTAVGVAFFNLVRRLGQLDLVISVSFVLLFSIIGSLMLAECVSKLLWPAKAKSVARGPRPWYFGLPVRVRFKKSRMYLSVIPILVLALLVGFLGAVLGIGGGFILVPALIYLFRMPALLAVGTSSFQILFTMTAALMLHATTSRTVDAVLALALIVGSVIGTQLGARAGRNLQGLSFRILFALLRVRDR